MDANTCRIGDCRVILPELPADTFDCCVTSPPYFGMRDYGHPDQIGAETTPQEYVAQLVGVFAEVRRVLRPDGTLWLNIGDAYASDGKHGGETSGKQAYLGDSDRKRGGRHKRRTGLKNKDLIGLPWMVAFALRADGWWLRSEIIWHKPNVLPESVRDRPTRAHEHVFLFSKSASYFYDKDAIAEPAKFAGQTVRTNGSDGMEHNKDGNRTREGMRRGVVVGDMRNARSVWSIPSEPFDDAHFAVMPSALAVRCVLAGSRLGGIVLDPFFGSGTVGEVAEQFGRRWFGIDLAYESVSRKRTKQMGLSYRRGE